MIKIMICVATLSFIFITVNGMQMLEFSYYWRWKYIMMQLNYLESEVSFFEYKTGGIWNWFYYRNMSDISENNYASSVPILLYHGIIDEPNWKKDGVNIAIEDFRNQMFELKKAGYQTISLQDYFDFKNGSKKVPAKSMLITFDDGRKDSYYMADPILKTVGYTAVMHVIMGRSLAKNNNENTFHLSLLELKKMLETGRWEIESHGRNDHDVQIIDANNTQGHYLSNKLWLENQGRLETDEEFKKRIENDLISSKAILEKYLGIKVLSFAFPFGDYGKGTKNYPQSYEILKQISSSVYPITFTQIGSSEFYTNYAGTTDIPSTRIGVSSNTSEGELLAVLNNISEKQPDFSDNFTSNKGWFPGWGSNKIKNESLVIGASRFEDSALTFLGGSYLWEDYYVNADAKVVDGNAFSMAARYIDGTNYVACSFNDDRILLIEKIGGVTKKELEAKVKDVFSVGNQINIGIAVHDNTASCFLNGKKMVESDLDGSLRHGGVSFMVWNTTDKNAFLTIKNFKVFREPSGSQKENKGEDKLFFNRNYAFPKF